MWKAVTKWIKLAETHPWRAFTLGVLVLVIVIAFKGGFSPKPAVSEIRTQSSGSNNQNIVQHSGTVNSNKSENSIHSQGNKNQNVGTNDSVAIQNNK